MGIVWGNTTPRTELPRDFFVGIGPLQLGIKLVLFSIKGANFPGFKVMFQYNFGDNWDIHGMRPTISGYFFSNNYDTNKHISFQDLYDPRGVIFFSKISFINYGVFEMGLMIIDISMACDISI